MTAKFSQSEFIDKCRVAHGDRYDYSLSRYKTANAKVKIICRVHGEFSQKAAHHMDGRGCVSCSSVAAARRYRTPFAEYVKKANARHGDIYTYPKTRIKNQCQKITIQCSDHGPFTQNASSHLVGYGCPTCGNHKRGRSNALSRDDFIKRAESVHGQKYDYTGVVYVNSAKHVEIVCEKHGVFMQAPGSHLAGSGCPDCQDNGINPSEPAKLYYVRITAKGKEYYKVGVTTGEVRGRFDSSNLDEILKTWDFDRAADALGCEELILTDPDYSHALTDDRGFLKRKGETECFEKDVLGVCECR